MCLIGKNNENMFSYVIQNIEIGTKNDRLIFNFIKFADTQHIVLISLKIIKNWFAFLRKVICEKKLPQDLEIDRPIRG